MKKLSNRTYTIIFVALFLILISFVLRKVYTEIDELFEPPTEEDLALDFNDAEKFIKYGYPEIKLLAIQLLTLLSAILVFSVTFSEKIINFNSTHAIIKILLITSWCLFIAAIIADGIGLTFNAYALPYALADVNTMENDKTVSAEFYEYAFTSIKAILMSGVFFVTGLICIVLSGIGAQFLKNKNADNHSSHMTKKVSKHQYLKRRF